MATRKILLGVGDSVRLGSDASVPLAIPTQALMLGQEMGFLRSVEIPLGYTAISAITLRYRRTGTGNLYLKFAFAHTASATGSTPTEDVDSYTVYAAGSADNKIANITVPAAAYSALTSMSAGDTLSIAVYRNDTVVTDTYTTDFDVVGFLIEFTVATTSDAPVTAAANAIITLNEVKDYLKIPLTTSDENDFLQLVINNQSNWIESQIQNKVVSQLITAELSIDTGRLRIRTKYFPIVSVTLLQYLNASAVWTDMVSDLTTVLINNPENQYSNQNNSFHLELPSTVSYTLYSSSSPVWNIKKSYYAGYSTVPTEIHDVCLERVVDYFKQSRRGQDRFGKESESNNGTVGSLSTRYIDFSPKHKEMLKPFKRRYE